MTDQERDEKIDKDARKMTDLKYMAANGSKEDQAKANLEMNNMVEGGRIYGEDTRVKFDPVTATMHVENSNKPSLNNLATVNSMEVHNNVPKAILAPASREKMSAT